MHNISTYLARKFFANNSEIDFYIYGMELFLSSVICTLLLLFFGFITNSFIESIIFIITFSALRIFTGGYHSNSYFACTLFTIIIYLLSLLFYNYFSQFFTSIIVYTLIFIVTIVIIALFSPIENSNKSLDKDLFRKCKIRALVVAFIEMMIFIVLYSIVNFNKVSIYIPTLIFVDVLMFLPINHKEGRKKDD